MKKKNEPKIWIAVTIFMALMVTSAFAMLAIGVVSATTWYVEEGESIQAAVDTANDGDTIIVRNGIYTENVNVNKRLTIRSESGYANCIVNASNPNDHIFEVTADYVNISGFTVENATGNGKAGIYLGTGVDYCNISDNNASNNDYGIYLRFSGNNMLTGNTMSGNTYNFCLFGDDDSHFNSTIDTTNSVDGKPIYYIKDNSSGIVIDSTSNAGTIYCIRCDNVTIKDRNLTKNGHGVFFWQTTNSRIENVNTENNIYGIWLSSSSNNNLTSNTASGNDYGIVLVFSSNNNLTNNTMSGNTYNFCLFGDDDSHFNNTIDTTNSVDGKPIYYIKDNSSGIVIDSTSNAGTIYCIRCDNVTIKDLNLTKNGHGVFFWQTTNSRIENVNTLNNSYGIWLYSSSNNNLTSNTASNNYIGIVLDSSSNNTLTDNTASNNRWFGIGLTTSSNNTLTDNTASNNNDYGIGLDSSSNYNTLTDNTASNNNYYGIGLSSSSNYNTLTSNTASNNGYGIYLYDSSNNNIYNNYFNNTHNAWDNGNNVWNTTKTAGTNIIGGPYLGGNYWSDYAGIDIDGDDLGDTLLPYNSSGDIANGGDYLPLVKPAVHLALDTGPGTYPSIMGNHTGTIKPIHTVIATKLYTYPCEGTGGHTEYARIGNKTWNATATWEGYAGDWHNITFDKTVVLLANKTYNYTIRTGSYPQIHHTGALPTENGWINCTKFTDANGRIYTDWIPAIRLE